MKIRVPLRKIKIDVIGCHLLVKATVNKKNIWLVLDTGASQTILDYHLAEEFSNDKPRHVKAAVSTGVGGESLKTHFIIVDRFAVGQAVWHDRLLVLLEMHHINNSYEKMGKQKIQGILGGDFLNLFQAIIDYKNKQLILTLPPKRKKKS